MAEFLPLTITDNLVGRPFLIGGRGPERYDCYGLLMELYRRRQIAIPDFESPSNWRTIHRMMTENLHLWAPSIQKPGAAMYIRLNSVPHHVGMYLGGGRFIHTYEGAGQVVIDSLRLWEPNVIGYYEFAGEPSQ